MYVESTTYARFQPPSALSRPSRCSAHCQAGPGPRGPGLADRGRRERTRGTPCRRRLGDRLAGRLRRGQCRVFLHAMGRTHAEGGRSTAGGTDVGRATSCPIALVVERLSQWIGADGCYLTRCRAMRSRGGRTLGLLDGKQATSPGWHPRSPPIWSDHGRTLGWDAIACSPWARRGPSGWSTW